MANKDKRARQLRREQLRRHQRALAGAPGASTPAKPEPLGSLQSAEADRAADGYRTLRARATEIARKRGDWAGVPMPITGKELVIAPQYRWAKILGAKPAEAPKDFTVRNKFWSTHLKFLVVVFQEKDGRITKGYIAGAHGDRAAKILDTLGCSDAWGMEQEERAMATLRGMVTARQYRHYVLTGTFLESSRRSGLTYLFRRLRPTLVLGSCPDRDDTRVLCALCMHPIAHYEGTWAGAMCPTDDVIAHLMLMRGDEAMYWKRSTQHQPDRAEAGL